MSDPMEEHTKQINDLKAWFDVELKSFSPIRITARDFRDGVDSLPEEYNRLCKKAFDIWLHEKKYELSYNQVCRAFFKSAKENGIIKVVV